MPDSTTTEPTAGPDDASYACIDRIASPYDLSHVGTSGWLLTFPDGYSTSTGEPIPNGGFVVFDGKDRLVIARVIGAGVLEMIDGSRRPLFHLKSFRGLLADVRQNWPLSTFGRRAEAR